MKGVFWTWVVLVATVVAGPEAAEDSVAEAAVPAVFLVGAAVLTAPAAQVALVGAVTVQGEAVTAQVEDIVHRRPRLDLTITVISTMAADTVQEADPLGPHLVSSFSSHF